MATQQNLASEASSEKQSEASSTGNVVRIGTRRSALAVIQAEQIRDLLQGFYPERTFEIHAMATMGDKNQAMPLHSFGAKALWTHELEAGLMQNSLDLVVHCLKDMPTQLPTGCILGAICNRADPRDAVVMKSGSQYKTLAELPEGSIIGTSSVRRSAQILRSYPGLKFENLRGNVGTRLSKLNAEDGVYACTLLAAAGLQRMGLDDRITQLLDSKTPGGGMYYAVGQAALAIEIRENDKETLDLLEPLVDPQVKLACLAERSLMRTLEGGCSVPIGVETEWIERGKLVIRAIVVSLDGSESVEAERLGEVLNEKEADEIGWQVAQALVEKGAGKILEDINLNRKVIEKGGGA